MASPESQSWPPKVKEIDLLELMPDDVLDPEHVEWWKKFSSENPVLAREVIRRAFADAREEDQTFFAIQKRNVDSALFAYISLGVAARRLVEERAITKKSTKEIEGLQIPIGDVDGEDPPLSA